MQSQKDFKRELAAFKDAVALAEFSNLEPDGVGAFRKRHRNFLPESCWSWTGIDVRSGEKYTLWQPAQALLRKVWTAEFPAESTLELVTNAMFLIAHTLMHDNAQEAESAPQIVWPYQRAVLFLHVHPVRARICRLCGRRFVSETKAVYCPYGTTAPLDMEKIGGLRERGWSWQRIGRRLNHSANAIRKCYEAGDTVINVLCQVLSRKSYKKDMWANKYSVRINPRRRQEYRLKNKRSPAHAKRKDLRQR